MKSQLAQRLRKAIEEDPGIICARKDVHKHPGVAESHLEWLGLSRNDLKRLERFGLALRAYTKNVWLPGEVLPNGKVADGGYTTLSVRSPVTYSTGRGSNMSKRSSEMYDIQVPNKTYRGSGSRLRWVIFVETQNG